MDKWSRLMSSCGILVNSFISAALIFASVTGHQGQSELSFSRNFSSFTVRLRPELDTGQDKPHLVVFEEPLMNLGNMKITFYPAKDNRYPCGLILDCIGSALDNIRQTGWLPRAQDKRGGIKNHQREVQNLSKITA